MAKLPHGDKKRHILFTYLFPRYKQNGKLAPVNIAALMQASAKFRRSYTSPKPNFTFSKHKYTQPINCKTIRRRDKRSAMNDNQHKVLPNRSHYHSKSTHSGLGLGANYRSSRAIFYHHRTKPFGHAGLPPT